MNPKDLDQAAVDVKAAVEQAVMQALEPYQSKSIVFLFPKGIAEDIGRLAEQCIRSLPGRVFGTQP